MEIIVAPVGPVRGGVRKKTADSAGISPKKLPLAAAKAIDAFRYRVTHTPPIGPAFLPTGNSAPQVPQLQDCDSGSLGQEQRGGSCYETTTTTTTTEESQKVGWLQILFPTL